MSAHPTASTVEVELRKGNLLRRNDLRAVTWHCTECSAHGSNTGAGSSHAASKRHEVSVLYAVAFAFVPAELAEVQP